MGSTFTKYSSWTTSSKTRSFAFLQIAQILSNLAGQSPILEIHSFGPVWPVGDEVQLVIRTEKPHIACIPCQKWPITEHTMPFHDWLRQLPMVHHLVAVEERWIHWLIYALQLAQTSAAAIASTFNLCSDYGVTITVQTMILCRQLPHPHRPDW